MKKIITAINNNEIIEKIKNQEYLFINKDISYREGILEVLEKNKEIDIIMINLEIPGEINFKKLIKEISKINKSIRIILISNDENKLKEYKEEKYFINNINEKEINKIINNKKEKNNEFKKNIKISENLINKEKINIELKNNEIIFLGVQNTGKTLLMLMIANIIKNKKILIVNKDDSIFKYLGIKNNKKIVRYKRNIDIINYKIYKNEIKNKYDLLFYEFENIDNNKLKENKKIILIINGNLINIDRSKNLIKNKLNNYYLIINKINKYSINKEIIKIFFNNSKVIGEIKNNIIFEKYINNNFKNVRFNKKEKKEYKEIIKNIERMI